MATARPGHGAGAAGRGVPRAVGADAGNVFALNNLAWALLEAGRSGEALPLARKAAGLEPWNAAALDTLAGIMEDLGQCVEALAVQRRAVDVLSERASAQERASYAERIARLEKSCGSAAARPASQGALSAPSHGAVPPARRRTRPPGQPRPADPVFAEPLQGPGGTIHSWPSER